MALAAWWTIVGECPGGPVDAPEIAAEPGRTIFDRLVPPTFTSEDGNLKLTPVVAPFFSPTLEAAVGGGVLATFSTDPSDPGLPRSTAQFIGLYSTRDAYSLGLRANTFWWGDRVRTSGFALYVDDLPFDYFGVGFDNGQNVPRGRDTTRYNATNFRFKPTVTTRVKDALFIGFNFDVNYQDAENPAPPILADPDFQHFGPSYTDVGAGFTINWDTRDMTVNPFKGNYFLLQSTHYRDWLGSDFEFDSLDLDLRTYIPVIREGSRLALMLQSRYTTGDVPWASLTTPGSSRDLRGYRLGQYRDKTGIWGLVEYRHQLKKRDSEELSRHGLVGWAGLGFIGRDYKSMGGNTLPNAGVGYRFEVQERRNVRFDFGFGRDGDTGFYLSFNEAF